MIWALIVIYAAALLVWLDTRRIERKASKGPLHNADIIAAGKPRGHVDIVGGGYRVR